MNFKSTSLALSTLTACALAACSADDGVNPDLAADANVADASDASDGAPSDGAPDIGFDSSADAPIALKPFTSPGTSAPNGAILVTASGESLALGGYAFPPQNAGDPAFVDGWELTFTRLLVTVDKLRLSDAPDTAKSDPSQTGGLVAEVDGPWAIDLHKGGLLVGKGSTSDQSVPIAILSDANRAGGGEFDSSARYAFGFDTVAATYNAMNVNLDGDALADYADMIANGYAVLYVGTATFKGDACTSPDKTYDFTKLPPVVHFRFGFKSPTSYVNCQNPDIDGAAFPGEQHPRGVQTKAGTFVVAQVTIHTDHPFWESTAHDAPAHFDPIAALFIGDPAPTATIDSLARVDFTYFIDETGVNLPWRTCVPTYLASRGTVGYDPQGVAVNPSATPDKALRDFRDFFTYNQSTQGHLNSDGLCYVRRNFASPP